MDRVNNRQVGSRYENLAVQFLIHSGYVIIDRNFRSRHGEIDIVAMDKSGCGGAGRPEGTGSCLCFVEVKYRSSTAHGYPAEAVDHRKRLRIIAASDYYLALYKIPCASRRYDIVEIAGDRIRVIKGAFGGNVV